MSRRSAVVALIVTALVVAAGIGLYVRAASAVTPGFIALAGDVRAEEYVVRAPSITLPTPDYTVGIVTPATSAPKRPATGAPAGSASRAPAVSGFLSEVTVTEGASVTTGQVLARLDTTMLDLGVTSARAAATKARADLTVLENGISKLEDARAKLVTARRTVTAARASLAATITALVVTRTSLEASITAIKAIIAHNGPVPPYPAILAGLQNALTGLNAGLAGARKGLATIDAGLAKMAKGLAQIDSGLTQLRAARKLARVNIQAQDVAVLLAQSRRDSATIVSPVSGVVTFARIAGTAAIVGAPLVRIRPDGPTRVDTYLTTDQLAQVTIGTPVTVDFDSNTGGAKTGRIAVISGAAAVPPTGFPTAIVHMTRAVRVTIELDPGQTAPAGTPVDIEIRTGPAR
jgi:multidrug resistance efflux pump